MVLGGMFEFLESYFDGDVDIVGERRACAGWSTSAIKSRTGGSSTH